VLSSKPTWAVVEAGGSMVLAYATARNLSVMVIIEIAKMAHEWGFRALAVAGRPQPLRPERLR
jgi:hypothetical protein